jgi:hypothetical protein
MIPNPKNATRIAEAPVSFGVVDDAANRVGWNKAVRRGSPACPDVQVSELDMTIVTMVKQSALDLP